MSDKEENKLDKKWTETVPARQRRNDRMKLKQTEEQFVRRGRGVWERQKVYDYLANRHGDTPVAFSEIYGLFPWSPYDSINHVCESTVKNWFKALGVEVAK